MSRMAAVLFLVFMAIACLIPSPEAVFASSGKSAVNRAQADLIQMVGKAYGGFAKIKKMNGIGTRSHCKASSMSSISDASNQFECDIFSKQNKLRVEMDVLGQKNILGYDGKNGWTQIGDWICRSTDTSVQRLKDELDHGLKAIEDLDNPDCRCEILSQKTVQNKLCDVIKLIPKDGKWTVFYADTDSHLILRSEFMGHDNEQGIEALQVIEYSDYRPLSGFPIPYKVVEFIADRKSSETITESVVIDESLKDELFEMPAESEISRLLTSPVTIPFEYIGNEIIINARVNGGTERKFIVDSGASQTVIDKKTAQEIGPYTVSTFNVTTGAKAVPLSYTKLSKIQLADIEVENVSALVTDLSSFTAAIGQSPAGLIGANILRRFLVTIDYAQRKLVLNNPNNVVVAEDAFVIPTSPAFGSTALVVSGLVDNKQTVNFLVDTGAAFNNLSQSLAKKLNIGPVIPVGQIYGLDGQKLNIGSVKFKSLKLAGLEVFDPVFALQPDKVGSLPATGLFNAGSMGILGNPVWSNTELTIDYRNERLLVKMPHDWLVSEKLKSQLEKIDNEYLKSSNLEQATEAYKQVMKSAQEQGQKAMEALALSKLASCSVDKYQKTREANLLDTAVSQYEQASNLAKTARNRNVEARIFTQWAMLYLNTPRSNTDLLSGQALLKRALSKSPMEASIFAALGTAMVKTGKADVGLKFIDQALMLDPANWQALWAKYQLSHEKEKFLVLDQLSRYYPDFPQVKEASLVLKKPKPSAINSTTQTTNVKNIRVQNSRKPLSVKH